MKKVELLSPAGDYECLVSAVSNGADAVYVSGKDYGARKYANNFTLEELESATKYCHLYGVKIYVTVNTMIYEPEINELVEYVGKLHSFGVDALIMQDIGMIDLIHHTYPNMEIHASTQAHNHNEYGINYLESLGVKRVVLDREMSLSEINKLNINVEKEVFIHGALCVSYSGECLFSSLLLDRSGNRGACAGLCRLPYKLIHNNEELELKDRYLLSMKELNTTKYLKDILDSNVDSLKIEGRMKSKEYVGYITRVYRRLIDEYYQTGNCEITKEEEKNIAVLYNRSFTKGFINNEDKFNIVNGKTPNHQGILLGQVLDVGKKIKIKLHEDINQGDGVRLPNNEGLIANFIYNEKDLLINGAKKGEIIYLDNKFDLTKKGNVLKTLDSKLISSLSTNPKRQVEVTFTLKAHVGDILSITIDDGINKLTKESITIDKAINNPTTKEDLIEKLTKTGNTPFIVTKTIIDIDDNIFIPIKEVNNLRRLLTDELEDLRSNSKKEYIRKEYNLKEKEIKKTNTVNILVRNEEQLKYLLDKDVNIYIEDIFLYKKYKQDNVYLKTNRILNNLPSLNNENLLVSELGGLVKYGLNNNVVSDIYLNIANSYSVNLLNKLNIKRTSLSIELKEKELEYIVNNTNSNLELYVYGKPEVMIMKYCLLNKYVNNNEKNCHVCSSEYLIKGDNQEEYPIVSNNCYSKILFSKNIDLLNNISYYKTLGITNFRLDLYDETPDYISKLLKYFN